MSVKQANEIQKVVDEMRAGGLSDPAIEFHLKTLFTKILSNQKKPSLVLRLDKKVGASKTAPSILFLKKKINAIKTAPLNIAQRIKFIQLLKR